MRTLRREILILKLSYATPLRESMKVEVRGNLLLR